MSRTGISASALDSILAQETEEVWVWLLVIEASGMDTLYLVNNTEDVLADSQLYSAFPFQFSMARDADGDIQGGRVTIDNTDRSITAELEALNVTPTVTASLISLSRGDDVEVGPIEFKTKSMSYDLSTVSLSLEYDVGIQKAFPTSKFTATDFQGGFHWTSIL